MGTGERNLEKKGIQKKIWKWKSLFSTVLPLSSISKNEQQWTIRICVLLVMPLMAGKEFEMDTQISVPEKVSVKRVK